MRTISILLTAGLFMLAACTNTAEKPITQAEKEVLSQEVETTINKMMEGMKHMAVTQAFESNFLLDKDFKYIGIRGETMRVDAFSKEVHGVFDNLEKVDFAFSTPDIRIVTRDVAIVTMPYKGKFYFPGSTLSFPECGSTLVLQKIDNKWMVIHFHESLQESEFVTADL
ncbi:nuclear transport factor 2 family protein [uncultured Draconibacterium sp.]|uniref:nuclear transport factor 2 family protein n=1 Tax=uncultured Draconibacterium sp. TaxID=1573823 RepID=UPI0025EDE13C|nr:nuclear transport factor 2 family protein [uncultured Draconibacterium sp.]